VEERGRERKEGKERGEATPKGWLSPLMFQILKNILVLLYFVYDTYNEFLV